MDHARKTSLCGHRLLERNVCEMLRPFRIGENDQEYEQQKYVYRRCNAGYLKESFDRPELAD